jgi:hypothetical protein
MGLLRIVLVQRETISNSIGEENPKRQQKAKDGLQDEYFGTLSIQRVPYVLNCDHILQQKADEIVGRKVKTLHG